MKYFTLVVGTLLMRVAEGGMTDFCDAKTYAFSPMSDQNDYELVQVSMVTRHGDRAPYTIMGGAGSGSENETWDMCNFYDYTSTDFGASGNYQKVVIPTHLPFTKKVIPSSTINKNIIVKNIIFSVHVEWKLPSSPAYTQRSLSALQARIHYAPGPCK